MSDIDVTLRLPAHLVEQAQAEGILTNQRIAALIEAEMLRLQKWRNLDQSLEAARVAFRAEHGDLSEAEIMAMINELVHEARQSEA